MLVAALALVGACLSAVPARAFVVEVTTSVEIKDNADRGQLRDALESAVTTVLKEAIAFVPTVVVLTHAKLIGDRLWVRLLIADAEGEAAVGSLDAPPPTATRI